MKDKEINYNEIGRALFALLFAAQILFLMLWLFGGIHWKLMISPGVLMCCLLAIINLLEWTFKKKE